MYSLRYPTTKNGFFFVIATVLLAINGIKIIILLFGCCWQNRFNSKIFTGQIPQYDLINTENNKDKDNNNINNKNNNIRYNIYYRKEKNDKINNYNKKMNKKSNKLPDKEYSSQLNIKEQNNNLALMKESIKSN